MNTPAPRLGIHLRNFARRDRSDWSHLFAMAQAADRAGVDRVYVSEHVVMGERLSDYALADRGGATGGTPPTGSDGPWLDPLTVLSVIAATTERVRLGTLILLAALRTPAVLAKQLATLDVLSGGRLDIGVGVGWQEAEYAACGLDFETRGARLDAMLDVMGQLWRQESATFEFDGHVAQAVHLVPRPAQAGGVPMWISGTVNTRVATRIARHGVGWIPWGDDEHHLDASVPAMRAAVARAGGSPAGMRVVANVSWSGATSSAELAHLTDAMLRLLADGATDLVLHVSLPADEAAEELLASVVGAFRAAV